ncbi:MAG: complex I NDUFA9 subunit family protein [Betaproteobacteria bacterium]|nr:complex I NDUFA9 subunit family protein [Betaproteobacteria bacterium]MCC6246774.1 complex I NDUFA9 subunit family protein [Rubrivivax sp.]MCL4697325.1 complex I NDUFA9 subunit family protein [Burkholderiaceae bacterium]
MKKVLILGGSGFVGRSVCEQLVRRHPGLHMVLPTRRAAHASHLRLLPGAEVVVADVHDPVRLTALARGCDAVVNLIAILHGKAADFEAAHVRFAKTLARAMQAAGVKRLVHIGALGAASAAPSLYLRSKAAGEDALQAAGLAVTILRPSVIFGQHDRLLNLFARLQSFSPVLPLAAANAQFQPVWVEDVAAAVVAALEDGATAGRTIECCGPQVMSLGDIVRLAGRLAGHERPQIALPNWAARLQAFVLELLPGPPLISRDNLDSMKVPSVASGQLPGLADLGIVPTPIGAVAPGYLAPGQGVARLDGWRAAHR